MVKLDFGGVLEDVVTREEFSLKRAKAFLKNERVAILGYGRQGRGQGLNLRDNGINVIIGQRKEDKNYWNQAVSEGWKEGKNLYSDLGEAVKYGDIICYLLTDAAQKACWPKIEPHLRPSQALYFSHGFSIVYKKQTGIIPPDYIDVILVAPKGAGATVRTNFLNGSGINSSYAVYQDYTGHALERTLAMGIAIGSGFLFPTTFEKEVFSDLTGERGVLLGAIEGIFEAQYYELRRRGHDPSEAFNETVEEFTQSLIGIVGREGMDGMYEKCSETARIGALEWRNHFRKAVAPVFKKLYDSVKSGKETAKVLKASKDPNYIKRELAKMQKLELWKAGQQVRALRPENQKK